MNSKGLQERAGAEPMAVLRHLHEFSGNQNVLSYNGRQYVWNWMRFLGGKHTLMDVETKEVVAVGALQFTFAWQWITAWGFRCVLGASSCASGCMCGDSNGTRWWLGGLQGCGLPCQLLCVRWQHTRRKCQVRQTCGRCCARGCVQAGVYLLQHASAQPKVHVCHRGWRSHTGSRPSQSQTVVWGTLQLAISSFSKLQQAEFLPGNLHFTSDYDEMFVQRMLRVLDVLQAGAVVLMNCAIVCAGSQGP